VRDYLLGLRLLMRGGRGNRVRFALMTVGTAIGVCCLALVLTIPAILDAHDARTAARDPQALQTSVAHPTLVLERTNPFGSKPYTRVFIARGTQHTPAPPPGLRRLPRPGQVFVSPALRTAIRHTPGLRTTLPGRITGTIAANGLSSPDELFAYVGTRPTALHGADPLDGFGTWYASVPAVDPSTLNMLRVALASIVLLPLAVFLSVCARLSAATRARRLAALRLLGLSAKRTRRVSAAENVVTALCGTALGLGAYSALNAVLSRVGLPGFRWYPADGALTWNVAVICLVLCPALAWWVGRSGTKAASRDPLGTRRNAVARPPRWWQALLLVLGLGIVTGYCCTGLTAHPAGSSGPAALLVPAGILATGLGLVLALPLISHWLSRCLSRSNRGLALSLAMRRNEVEPGSAIRVVTGLVLLVFAASLAQGVLIEENEVSKSTNPIQQYGVPLSGVTTAQENRLIALPGVKGHAVMATSWIDLSGSASDPEITALVGTCRELRSLVVRLDSCQDGSMLRLNDPSQPDDPDIVPGHVFPFHLHGAGAGKTLQIRLPSRTAHYIEYDPSEAGASNVLIPPSALPSGARLAGSQLILSTSSSPAVVKRTLDRIASVVPTADIDAPGINVEALQQIGVIETLLGLGMAMGLVIGVAAYLVSVTDRAVERRAHVTALALIGARAGTLRAAQCLQVVLPLAAGLALAVLGGKVAESSYLVTGGGEVRWDWSGLPGLLAAAAGAVLLAALGALPLVGRRIDPELIRRD
jgi:hypothetical protein